MVITLCLTDRPGLLLRLEPGRAASGRLGKQRFRLAGRRTAGVHERRSSAIRLGKHAVSVRRASGCTAASTRARSTSQVPGDGVSLKYQFQAPKDATYQVWSRIGFEFVRSPFDWRIDDGPWKRVTPDELTTDLMEIAFWCEVAWLQLGRPVAEGGAAYLRVPLAQDQERERRDAARSCSPAMPSA